jgi:actin-binding LIM protein
LKLFEFASYLDIEFPTGTAIWHPRCGPGPTENGTVVNGPLENGHCTDGESGKESGREFDRMSSSASEMQASSLY